MRYGMALLQNERMCHPRSSDVADVGRPTAGPPFEVAPPENIQSRRPGPGAQFRILKGRRSSRLSVMGRESLFQVEGFQGEGVGRNEPRQFLALLLAFTSGYRRPPVPDTAT